MRHPFIDFMEKNREGYWVIHGCIGIRRYLYYTKREARKRYIEEVKQKAFFNKSRLTSL